MIAYIQLCKFSFYEGNILELKCLYSAFNVYSVKRVEVALLTPLNYWSSWTGSRIYYWTLVYCPELSGLPICCLFRLLRRILKRSKRLEKARRKTESCFSKLKVENINLRNGPNFL